MKNLLLLGMGLFLTIGYAQTSTRGSSQVQRELLLAVCNAGKVQSTIGKTTTQGNVTAQSASGCLPCPSYTSFAGEKSMFTLQNVIFAKPNNKQETLAILDFTGCEAHINFFGGTVLLQWQGGKKWKFLAYNVGQQTDDCLKFAARDGTDKLVCRGYYANMGIEVQSLALESFSKNSDREGLLSTTSNTGQCMNPNLFDFTWQKVARRDLNNDKRADLEVVIQERSAVLTAEQLCKSDVSSMTWQKTKTHTLAFLFDGQKFSPTKATAALVKYLEKFGQ